LWLACKKQETLTEFICGNMIDLFLVNIGTSFSFMGLAYSVSNISLFRNDLSVRAGAEAAGACSALR
jgi:hypothetical protein